MSPANHRATLGQQAHNNDKPRRGGPKPPPFIILRFMVLAAAIPSPAKRGGGLGRGPAPSRHFPSSATRRRYPMRVKQPYHSPRSQGREQRLSDTHGTSPASKRPNTPARGGPTFSSPRSGRPNVAQGQRRRRSRQAPPWVSIPPSPLYAESVAHSTRGRPRPMSGIPRSIHQSRRDAPKQAQGAAM